MDLPVLTAQPEDEIGMRSEGMNAGFIFGDTNIRSNPMQFALKT